MSDNALVARYKAVIENLYPDAHQQMIYTESLLEELARVNPVYMEARVTLLEERATK